MVRPRRGAGEKERAGSNSSDWRPAMEGDGANWFTAATTTMTRIKNRWEKERTSMQGTRTRCWDGRETAATSGLGPAHKGGGEPCGGGGATSSRPIAKKPSLLPVFCARRLLCLDPFSTGNVCLRFCLRCRRGPSAPARVSGSKCPFSSFSFSQLKKGKKIGFLWCQPTAAPGQVPSRKREREGGSPARSGDPRGAGQPTVSPFGPHAESVVIAPPMRQGLVAASRRGRKICQCCFSNDFFLLLAARRRASRQRPKKENADEK